MNEKLREIWDRIKGPLSRTDELAASIVFAVVAVAAFRRLAYGVDPADESFGVTLIQRFALGDRPYADELNLRQTAGLLAAPLYWAYVKLVGSTDGVVYFLRVVFFTVQAAVGWAVFELAERRVPRAFAIVAACLPFTFVPFAIPTPNYNNLGTMLLAAGTMIGLRGLLDKDVKTLRWAGVVHGLACVAYAPTAVPVTLFALATRFLPERPEAEERPWRSFLFYAMGIAFVAIPFFLILGPGVFSGAKKALEYEGWTTRPRTFDKAKGIFGALVKYSPAGSSSLATLGVAWLISSYKPAARRWVFAVAILWVAYTFADVTPEWKREMPAHVLSLHVMVYLGLLGALFMALLDWRTAGRTMLFAGWLPAFVASFMAAMASDNDAVMNGGLGLFTAALLALVAAPWAAETKDAPLGPAARVAGVAALAVIPLTMTSINWLATYSDGPVDTAALVRVKTGPFRGLRGTPLKVTRVEEMARELRALVKPGDRMLSYYDFPGAYLSVPCRPAVQTVWTDHRAKVDRLLPYYQSHRTGQGVAFLVLAYPGMAFPGTSPELEKLVESPERLIKDGGWYRIYREPPP